MSELVAAAAQDELLILPRGKVRLHGIDFDEDFLSELVARHFRRQQWLAKPMFSDAYGIYVRENPSAHRRKFKTVAQHAYALFVAQFGDMALDELRHVHITEFRDRRYILETSFTVCTGHIVNTLGPYGLRPIFWGREQIGDK